MSSPYLKGVRSTVMQTGIRYVHTVYLNVCKMDGKYGDLQSLYTLYFEK